MSEENFRELFKALREHHHKYAYFLLAAAGAAIALAVTQTHGQALAWSQVPLAVAVVAWALSFWAGCRHLHYVGTVLVSNGELLQVQSGADPDIGPNPVLISARAQGIRAALATNSAAAASHSTWQFRLFVAGGVAYVAWHVWEMYLRGHPGVS